MVGPPSGVVVVPLAHVAFHVSSQLGLMPWMPYADYKDLEMDNRFIMFAIKPQIELMNQYNESIGSGLVVPEKNVSAPNLTLTT